jgi:hypothetical protein
MLRVSLQERLWTAFQSKNDPQTARSTKHTIHKELQRARHAAASK